MAIKIENPNQFVPLFTNPQEVIETRNKVILLSLLLSSCKVARLTCQKTPDVPLWSSDPTAEPAGHEDGGTPVPSPGQRFDRGQSSGKKPSLLTVCFLLFSCAFF